MKRKKSHRKLVSIPTTPQSNVVRLRPVGTPAHLRTDFKPTDSDIKTLVGNVLSGRNRLMQVKIRIQDLMAAGQIPIQDGNEILDIINRPEPQ